MPNSETDYDGYSECLHAYKYYLNHIDREKAFALCMKMDRADLNGVTNNIFPCYDVMVECWNNKFFTDNQWNAIVNVMGNYLYNYDDLGLNSKLGLWEREKELAEAEALREEF